MSDFPDFFEFLTVSKLYQLEDKIDKLNRSQTEQLSHSQDFYDYEPYITHAPVVEGSKLWVVFVVLLFLGIPLSYGVSTVLTYVSPPVLFFTHLFIQYWLAILLCSILISPILIVLIKRIHDNIGQVQNSINLRKKAIGGSKR